MRIGYLVDSTLFQYSGGGVVHVWELVRAFERAGHEVVLLASDSGRVLPHERPKLHWRETARCTPSWRAVLRALLGAPVRRMARRWRELGKARRAERMLAGALRQLAVDAVYERYTLYNAAGVECCRRLGIPHVMEVNSTCDSSARYGDHFLDPVATAIERRAFHATDAVLVVSASVRDEVLAHDVAPARVHVVPNGVDTMRFAPEVDGEPLRTRYGLTGFVVIGMVAFFKRWHGLDHLLRAVAPVVERCPEARFLLVGEGETRGAVARHVHEQGLSDLVVATGEVDHDAMPAHIAAMDITVIPHFHHHGSPLKLFEYMASGKPTVAVAIGQITECVRPGETGVLVPPNDVEALCSALIDLIGDPLLRKHMGLKAREWVQRERSWDGVARHVLELWATADPKTP